MMLYSLFSYFIGNECYNVTKARKATIYKGLRCNIGCNIACNIHFQCYTFCNIQRLVTFVFGQYYKPMLQGFTHKTALHTTIPASNRFL